MVLDPIPDFPHTCELPVATCNHGVVGSQSSAGRAPILCNWGFGSGARSLQLGSHFDRTRWAKSPGRRTIRSTRPIGNCSRRASR